MTDNREFPRVSAELVLFDAGSAVYKSVATRDVSPGGAFIVLGKPLPTGTQLRLAIARRGKGSGARVRQLIEVRGEVKWSDDTGIGIAFIEPSEEFIAELNRLTSTGKS